LKQNFSQETLTEKLICSLLQGTKLEKPERENMRKVTALILVLGLLIPSTGGLLLDSVTANPSVYLPYITIKSDGNIEPETEFITQKGSTYTLTGDVSGKYALVIQCSNIVLDGAGYIINGSSVYGRDSNSGISIENVKNVTVKDISIFGFMGRAGILLENCSNCLIFNSNTTWNIDLPGSHFITVSDCYVGYTMSTGVNNLVTRSNIDLLYLDKDSFITQNNITNVLMSSNCHNNTLFSNNFIGQNNFIGSSNENFWDNGSIGNYWSDYKIKYPAASEIGDTGIGNIPYVINAGNVDNFPAIAPFILQPLPKSTPTIVPEPESSPDLLPFLFIVVVSAVLIVATAFLVYFKKHKHMPISGC
jgi:nitrous oxidase accessory protein NosD